MTAEADVRHEGNKLIIKKFYPLNVMRKLRLDRKIVTDWKVLVDSIIIDFDYSGAEMKPSIIDIPKNKNLVKGEYDIPGNAGCIKVKIIDILWEEFEVEIFMDD